MKHKISWRQFCLPDLIEPIEGLGGIYEFGVFSGHSLQEIVNIYNRKKVPYSAVLGFDSFDGIPLETAEPIFNPAWDRRENHYFNAFNAQDYYKISGPENVAKYIHNSMEDILHSCHLAMITGYYCDTLTSDLATRIKNTYHIGENNYKASYVDIDVDIYTSAIEALEWMFSNKLLDVGTLVGYDDWGGTPGYKTMADGESRAHREITEKYGVTWEQVASNDDHVEGSQVIFRITGIA